LRRSRTSLAPRRLTPNKRPRVVEIAGTVSQIVFRFAIEVGMIALTGMTSAEHMREDLAVFDFSLEPKNVARIEQLIG